MVCCDVSVGKGSGCIRMACDYGLCNTFTEFQRAVQCCCVLRVSVGKGSGGCVWRLIIILFYLYVNIYIYIHICPVTRIAAAVESTVIQQDVSQTHRRIRIYRSVNKGVHICVCEYTIV